MKAYPWAGAKMAVLSIISRRSRGPGRTIAAATLREIRNDLRKYYLRDLKENWILKTIEELGDLVVRETHPRNQRRTLYRINPERSEETILSLVKLDEKRVLAHDGYEGVLYDPPVEGGFLAIDNLQHPPKVRTNQAFTIEVNMNYGFPKHTSVFLAARQEGSVRWLVSNVEALSGDGVKTFGLKLSATQKPGCWRLEVKAYVLSGLAWREADSMLTSIEVDEKYPREITVSGGRTVERDGVRDEEYYALTIEVDDEEEVEEARAYGRALINSWLAAPPSP